MIDALGLPDDLSDEEVDVMHTYVELTFRPVAGPGSFTYDRAYTEELARFIVRGKMVLAKNALKKGLRGPSRQGVAYMSRVVFGLSSLLSRLGAEVRWADVTGE